MRVLEGFRVGDVCAVSKELLFLSNQIFTQFPDPVFFGVDDTESTLAE